MPTSLTRVRTVAGHTLAAMLISTAALAAQEADSRDPAADLVKQAQERIREGRFDEALALDRRALAAAPGWFQANSQAGAVLDLLGRHDEARQHLARAIDAAPTPPAKARALRSMAVSYAFQSDCRGATPYEQQAYDAYLTAADFYSAGEAADELARICLEAGDLDAAARWYRTGYETGLREPGIEPARKDLWAFRWEHTQARLAARRGDRAAAERHVRAATAILDRGTNPDQRVFLPYLTGYVALYAGDARTALADLQQANQNDPFILCLIAQAYEKLDDAARAQEYYRKALARAVTHNPPTAYARPLAEKQLGR